MGMSCRVRAVRCLPVALALAASLGVPSAGARSPAPPTLPSNEEIYGMIADLTANGPRRPGSTAERQAVDYVAGTYRAAGLTGVHIEQTPTYAWEATSHALRVGGTVVDAFPVAYSLSPAADAEGTTSTPPGGVTAPLVEGGLGTAAELPLRDVKGKVVVFDLRFLLPTAGLLPLTEFLWDPQNTMLGSADTLLRANPYLTTFTTAIQAIQDAGAVGFVGVLADYFDSNRYYNEFYRRLNVTLPGMWVTKGAGARVRRLMAAAPGTTATIELSTVRRKVPAHVVIGYLEGRSRDTIMVQSHHDSVWAGAVEDGSGTAEVLALAKHFGAQPPRSREKSLMFATFGSHFSGYQAHQAFAERHILARTDPHRLVANVTLEHIGREAAIGPAGQLQVSDLVEPRGIFETLSVPLKNALIAAVVRNDLRRTAVLGATPFQVTQLGIPTDASFGVITGLPTVSLISGPAYMYDEADTLDKVAKEELQPVAQTFAEVIDAIDPVPSSLIGLIPGVPGRAGRIEEDAVPPASGSGAACVPARRGRPVTGARLRGPRRGRGPATLLSFRARRTVRVGITVRYRGGRSVRLKRTRALRACRHYTVGLPAAAAGVSITAGRQRVSVHRAGARREAAGG